MPDTIHLLRMIRGVSQQTEQLTVVLAGVNAAPSESPVIAEDDNPLFGLLSVRYLGPLDPASCAEMIRDVGRRMRMRWDPAATKAVTAYVGGHPLLARLAASDVWSRHPERPLRPTAEMVQEDLKGFHVRNSNIFVQMIQSLRRYYPDELEVLKIIADGRQGIRFRPAPRRCFDAEPPRRLRGHRSGDTGNFGPRRSVNGSVPRRAHDMTAHHQTEQVLDALAQHQLVVFVGARGTGKTCLIENLSAALTLSGVTVLNLDAALAQSASDLLSPVARLLQCKDDQLTTTTMPDTMRLRVLVDNCDSLHEKSWFPAVQDEWRGLLERNGSTRTRGVPSLWAAPIPESR